MKIFVAYATSEGHTRKIARWAADRIYEQGHSVELAPFTDAMGLDIGRFDGAVLASSIHAGHYQAELAKFADKNANRLGKMPTLFLSVSLAAAGHDAEDWRGLDRILDDFKSATNWSPERVVQVAGAYMPSEYDIFRRFIMRRIIAGKEADADLDADHDYTDWSALGAELDSWVAQITK